MYDDNTSAVLVACLSVFMNTSRVSSGWPGVFVGMPGHACRCYRRKYALGILWGRLRPDRCCVGRLAFLSAHRVWLTYIAHVSASRIEAHLLASSILRLSRMQPTSRGQGVPHLYISALHGKPTNLYHCNACICLVLQAAALLPGIDADSVASAAIADVNFTAACSAAAPAGMDGLAELASPSVPMLLIESSIALDSAYWPVGNLILTRTMNITGQINPTSGGGSISISSGEVPAVTDGTTAAAWSQQAPAPSDAAANTAAASPPTPSAAGIGASSQDDPADALAPVPAGQRPVIDLQLLIDLLTVPSLPHGCRPVLGIKDLWLTNLGNTPNMPPPFGGLANLFVLPLW